MNLNEQIAAKAKQNREEALSFEQSLQLEFDSLTEKSEENLEKLNEQIDLRNEAIEIENEIANKVSVIAAMFSKNALLENLFYNKVEEKISKFPKKTPEELNIPSPQTPSPSSPNKMASGGVVPGQTKQERKEKQLQPYADTLSLPLQASGIAALSVLGDFIKSSGSLGGFFKPYLNSIVKPFSIALGITDSLVNSLVGGPVQAATLDLNEQQKYFGKTWGQFLGDEDFIKKFIDRTIDPSDPNRPPGFVPANWKDDPEFTAELNRVAKKFNINANDLLAVMLVETGGTLKPDIRNPKSGATGLIQFMPSTAAGLGTSTDELARMTRAEQMKYVEKYFDNKLPQGATGGQIYAAVFLPAFIKEDVLTVRGERYYEANVGLDYNQDGKITRSDLDAHVEEKKKKYKLQEGASIGKNISPGTPYLITGPDGGYDTTILGMPVTLHGSEIVVESSEGFQVYPVKNKRYNIFKDPLGVSKRWRQIAMGANTQRVNEFSSGGVSEGVKAIQHDEALSSLTRGVNDFITRGGLSVHSSMPWGRIKPTTPIHAYETGVSGDRTTIGWGMTYYDSITAGKKVVKPGDVITKSKADSLLTGLVNNYVTTLKGQKWYQKYWNKMSSQQQGGLLAYGYNQPAHLLGTGAPKMYAALNRGDMNAVAANVDRGLPQREKNEKRLILSGPRNLNTATAASSTKPKVIVNRVGAGSSQPNIVQQVQDAVTFIPNLIFNPRKLKRELGMRRAR